MRRPQQLVFSDDWADTDFTGVPLSESVLSAFIGRCQVCGRPAEAQRSGSVLLNPLVVEGTLYGDTFCTGCCEEEPKGCAFVLPPLDVAEGGDESS